MNIKILFTGEEEEKSHSGSSTLPPNSGLHPTSSSVQLTSFKSASTEKEASEDASECNSSLTSESISNQIAPFASRDYVPLPVFDAPIGQNQIETALRYELQELRDENSRLREEMDTVKVCCV